MYGKAAGRGWVGLDPCCETFHPELESTVERLDVLHAATHAVYAAPPSLTQQTDSPCYHGMFQVTLLGSGRVRGSAYQKHVWLSLGQVLSLQQHSLGVSPLLPCPRTSALGLLRGPVVFLVADWQCPFSRVCTECFSPAQTSPIAPGQQPPTSSSTFAHTRPAFFTGRRGRRKAGPRENRTT